MIDYPGSLNREQQNAAASADRHLLVVAGPGTGKTLTIVHRIARLVEQGTKPENILAVTFTNRAACEMKERAAGLLGNRSSGIFIGTFHLLGLRIIKECISRDFAILGRDQQIELLKPLVKDSRKNAEHAAEKISRMKNQVEEAEDGFTALFEAYQEELRRRNAYDFDDLVLVPAELLENGPGREAYRDRFTHIIVDEYQDINPVQYRLLRLVAGKGATVCAVGDPDQAIYGFRGADLGSFLNFENDFTGARRITLCSNYRSAARILDAADGVIRNNRNRLDKRLEAVQETGRPVQVISVPDDRAEGAAIVAEIEARMGGTSHERLPAGGTAEFEHSYRFSDFAVIYRTNAQARALEEAFAASGIPFQVIGKRTSAQRKETEEMIAFLNGLAGIEAGDGRPPEDRNGNASHLLTDADFFDPRADAVALMTMHMAKGLEFNVVFLAGCEEGLVPCSLMKEEPDIEEERRLFYVGMTRARRELFLVHARRRFLFGQRLEQKISRFAVEIPEQAKEANTVADRTKKLKPAAKQMGLF